MELRIVIATKTVFELTIYSVKDIKLDTFHKLRAKVFQFLRESDGYYEGTTYRSLKNKATFVDYVIWDSQDRAKSAAQAFAESSLHVEFSDAIEKAQLHDYSALLQDGELGDTRNLNQNDVIELGAFILNSERLTDFIHPGRYCLAKALNTTGVNLSAAAVLSKTRFCISTSYDGAIWRRLGA